MISDGYALRAQDAAPEFLPQPQPQRVPIVRLRGVSKRFGTVSALDDISLSVANGEVLGIIGRSGAGKSTLIRCLNGLERPDSGSVEIEGTDITVLPERALTPVRRRIGMIFQHFNLLSSRTVAQNVALPLKVAGWGRAQRTARAAELLELVGLSDKACAYPAQLSGGQKQRVGIARALAGSPSLLLSDESTSALDPETTLSILDLLRDINRRLGLTIVLITHEMSVVRAIADRVVVLEAGRISESGALWEIFARPQQASTQRLLAGLRPSLPAAFQARVRNPAEPGDWLLLRLDLFGAQARLPVLSLLNERVGVAPVLLHGGVEHVQDQPLGRFFIALPNRDGLVTDLATALHGLVGEYEVLGYVPHPN